MIFKKAAGDTQGRTTPTRYLTWSNAAFLMIVAFVGYRVFSIRHVRGPRGGKVPAITMLTLDGRQIALQYLGARRCC